MEVHRITIVKFSDVMKFFFGHFGQEASLEKVPQKLLNEVNNNPEILTPN